MIDLIVLVLTIAAVSDLARSVLGRLPLTGYLRPAAIGGAALAVHLIGGWGILAGLAWLVLLTTTWLVLATLSAVNALHLVWPAYVPLPPWYATALAYGSAVLSTLLGIVVSLGALFKAGWYWAGLNTLSSALCITAIASLVIPHITSAARAKRDAQMVAALREIEEG